MATFPDAAEEVGTLTCPGCGASAWAPMPRDACVRFLECPGCGTLIRPRPGDCCVFCSYGGVPCIPRRAELEQGT